MGKPIRIIISHFEGIYQVRRYTNTWFAPDDETVQIMQTTKVSTLADFVRFYGLDFTTFFGAGIRDLVIAELHKSN